ncbi:glutathione S-transferase N-terminal domain-containing protein [Methylocystis echinoides]|uniref:glutathione S-transferase family protein n=1 Tax=Methylocystis echinoides TaxID=29468 RepID=UPI003424CF7D
MFTLYYHPGACSLAAHIALEWIGAPYATKEVEFGDKEYLKINPAGAVPALDDGSGWILTQDAAILRYLAHRHPQARLAVEGGDKEQAEADRWSFFITGDLHPAFFPLFVPNRYTRAREKEAFDDIREAAKALAHKKFLLVDAQLTGKRFFLGDKRSYLDAYVFPMERWAQTLLDDGLSAFPAVRAHHDMMAADPAVQRVLAAEGA